jgi:hypothetical protein
LREHFFAIANGYPHQLSHLSGRPPAASSDQEQTMVGSVRLWGSRQSGNHRSVTMLKTSAGTAALFVGLLLGGTAFAQTSTAPKSTTAPAMKMTQAECTALWGKLDTSNSGSVSQAQAQTYVKDFKAIDTNKDGKLSKAEFQSGCDKGQVHSSATTGAASGTGSSATPPTAPKK